MIHSVAGSLLHAARHRHARYLANLFIFRTSDRGHLDPITSHQPNEHFHIGLGEHRNSLKGHSVLIGGPHQPADTVGRTQSVCQVVGRQETLRLDGVAFVRNPCRNSNFEESPWVTRLPLAANRSRLCCHTVTLSLLARRVALHTNVGAWRYSRF